MADKTFSAFVASGQTTGAVTIPGPPSQLQWIVWQINLQTVPYRSAATAVVKRNGSLQFSTFNGGQDSAVGPPALALTFADTLTVVWNTVVAGDELLVNIGYEETPFGQLGTTFGLI